MSHFYVRTDTDSFVRLISRRHFADTVCFCVWRSSVLAMTHTRFMDVCLSGCAHRFRHSAIVSFRCNPILMKTDTQLQQCSTATFGSVCLFVCLHKRRVRCAKFNVFFPSVTHIYPYTYLREIWGTHSSLKRAVEKSRSVETNLV